MEGTKNTSEQNIEANEIQDTTQESLDDATYEPRAHVENNGDYKQAEDIQNTLTELAENEEEGLAEQTKIRGDLDNVTADQSDEDKDEATPINLPGPQPANEDVALTPDDVKLSEEPEPGPDPYRDTDHIAGHDHPDDPPPPPDLSGETALSPDDVKLEPAPDFKAMNESERAVVDVIEKAIADEEYRATLFADAQAATTNFAVTEGDQVGLNEMTPEAFEFFAAEVEARLAAAGEEQEVAQVVHAVWRDLNPGGLVYVLTYKIPQYHLP